MAGMIRYWFWMLFLLPGGLVAEELELDSGASLIVSRFDADSNALVIWLPSERGFDRDFSPVGRSVAEGGQAIWVANLHESYMVPAGRRSIDEFDPNDIVSLIRKAGDEGYAQVVLFAASRGARLAIQASRLWQAEELTQPRLIGIISPYPNLTVDGQHLGRTAQYLPIARAYNLPFYLLQPEFSTKFAHAGEIRAALEEGGASVFLHKLPGVQGGFHIRTDEDVTPADLEAKARFPAILKRAVALMATQSLPMKPVRLPEAPELAAAGATALYTGNLQPYTGKPKPGAIDLPSLTGGRMSSDDWEGETVLLNFWATWCGPCVKEIPSLGRLQEHLKDKPFRIVSVNIGESAERIRDFAKRVPIDFPVLLDEDSQLARDWSIYAYPSNYLLNPQGEITHAYRGALEWDDEEVVDVISQAITEGQKGQ